MGIFKQIYQWINQEPWVKSVYHTFWHVLGTLLPLIIVLILSRLFHKQEEVKHFIEDGEFCILSAAILTPATWILTRYSIRPDKRIRRFPAFVFGLAITIILCSASLFTAVYLNRMQGNLEIDKCLVRKLSIFFLVISIVIFLLAHWIDYKDEFGRKDAKSFENDSIERMDETYDQLP